MPQPWTAHIFSIFYYVFQFSWYLYVRVWKTREKRKEETQVNLAAEMKVEAEVEFTSKQDNVQTLACTYARTFLYLRYGVM